MKRNKYMSKDEIMDIAKKIENSNDCDFILKIRKWCYRNVNKLDDSDVRISVANARYLFKVCDTKLHWEFGIDNVVEYCKSE